MAATVGILVTLAIAVVAVQVYHTALLRAKFTAVVKATDDFKKAIELCAKLEPCAAAGALSGYKDGMLGIPYSRSGTYLASVQVASHGAITATATSVEGLAGETYVLTPSHLKGAPIVWAVSGTCKTRPAGAIC
jgi:hypothetical protein